MHDKTADLVAFDREENPVLVVEVNAMPHRRREELGLWLALGAARMITHGQAAPETKDAYDHAAALAGNAAERAFLAGRGQGLR